MTRKQISKLAAKADVDVRTVLAFVAGAEVRPASARRITKAAKMLKLNLPSSPTTTR